MILLKAFEDSGDCLNVLDGLGNCISTGDSLRPYHTGNSKIS
jgi:hypothetical protein